MSFRPGDRVRIKNPVSEYTGCRGTIVVDAADQPTGLLPLGHFVAIDGENGRTRPFLVADLERLEAARVKRARPNVSSEERAGSGEAGRTADRPAPRKRGE
jgi:hypothetical protein